MIWFGGEGGNGDDGVPEEWEPPTEEEIEEAENDPGFLDPPKED